MQAYQKNGETIRYQLIRKANKHTYFRIKEGYVQITSNLKTKEKVILSYLDLHFDAIYAKLQQKQQKETDHEVILWNEHYQLLVYPGRFQYEIKHQQVIAFSKENMDIETLKKRIYAEEIKRMLALYESDIEATLANLNMQSVPMIIKYLKSKFGSYHRKHRTITLNSFLAKLDPIYLLYVVYHEYAHTKIFNHSQAFYEVLDQMMPNHKKYQKTLKKIAI